MRRRDPLTPDLFSWTPPKVTVGPSESAPTRGALDGQIARQVSQVLRVAREAGDGRADVARRLSDLLDRPISEATLNKWASEASEEHRIPLDAVLALIEVTGCHELLGFIAGRFGYVVVEERYADLIQLHLIEEHEHEVAAMKAALQTKWRARR